MIAGLTRPQIYRTGHKIHAASSTRPKGGRYRGQISKYRKAGYVMAASSILQMETDGTPNFLSPRRAAISKDIYQTRGRPK